MTNRHYAFIFISTMDLFKPMNSEGSSYSMLGNTGLEHSLLKNLVLMTLKLNSIAPASVCASILFRSWRLVGSFAPKIQRRACILINYDMRCKYPAIMKLALFSGARISFALTFECALISRWPLEYCALQSTGFCLKIPLIIFLLLHRETLCAPDLYHTL